MASGVLGIVGAIAAGASGAQTPAGRVIYQASFNEATKAESAPGDYELVSGQDIVSGGVARAVVRPDTQPRMISLPIEPPRAVGARTRLQFRYRLSGAASLTVQVFDFTVMDNRHVNLTGLGTDRWAMQLVDITRDSRRNDGSSTPLVACNLVDAIFFFVTADGNRPVDLLVDDVVLFDAADAR